MRVFVVLSWLLVACGPSLPPRFVLERDVDDLSYRRYQHVLDVELPVAGNPAEGHTATYLRRGDEIGIATAFVTVYERAASLTAELRERLDELASYELETVKLEGKWVWRLAGDEATWVLWVSGRHVVKLGVPSGHELSPALVRAYLRLYPSDLGADGRARPGTESAGMSSAREEEEQDLDVPSSLREGAPR